MTTLELRQLCKSFADLRVVDQVDLQVEQGEFLVLVGPSGCGKSTLLRLIAGLEHPEQGQILIDGIEVSQREPWQRDVAMVFQNYALYPHMTVAKNVGFPLRIAKVAKAQIVERVQQACQLLGIEKLLERKPAQLSGGQQQRVALARALVRRPKLFLFDEPLSNVDAKLRAEMRAELARLHQTLHATMIYVTHDQVEAMTLGSRIAVIHQGQLQQIGTPMEIFQKPANAFVASFMGSPPMNLLRAESAQIGFRPHDCALKTDSSAGPNSLELQVELVEALGHEQLLHGKVRHGTLLGQVVEADQKIVCALASQVSVATGSTLNLQIPESALHSFELESGARIE
jgi:ABC-type sugar transport system ATPase subunit